MSDERTSSVTATHATTESVRKFYGFVRRAAIDALGIIRDWEAAGKFIPRRYVFPKCKTSDSGLPWFEEGHGLLNDTPVDYIHPFTTMSADRRPLPGSWERLWEFVRGDKRLSVFFHVDQESASSRFSSDPLGKFDLQVRLQRLIDHYIHTTGLKRFRRQSFLPVFIPWAASCYPKKLDVEFVVPILHVDFAIDEVQSVGVNTRIEKMTEIFQLSRAPTSDDSTSISRHVLGAASHALVLANWEVPNERLWDRERIAYRRDALDAVLLQVDRFLAALRVATGFDTGYGQVIMRPVGWCDRWDAHLKPVSSLSLRSYSERLEGSWRSRERPLVSGIHLTRIESTLSGLEKNRSNSVSIAAKRLNGAFLRREEADTVIDICIGLEALFVADGRGEITHKLATRLAALWSLEPAMDLEPFDVFNAVKKLYGYRSALVHGSGKAEKQRVIRPRPGVEVEAVEIGTKLLRHSLEIIVQKPELLEASALDKVLLYPGR